MLTLFQHKLIRTHAKENLKKLGATEAFLKAQSELQAMWDDAIQGGKKLKKRGTPKLAQLDGIRSTSVFEKKSPAVPIEAEQVVTHQELIYKPADIPVFKSFDLSTHWR